MGFLNQPQIVMEKDPVVEAIRNKLSNINPDTLTPRQAMEELYNILNMMEDDS